MITNNSPYEMLYLLQQQTTNVTTSPLLLNLSSNKAAMTIWGTWNGATVTIQVGTVPNIDSTVTWITVRDRLNVIYNFTQNMTITLTEYVNGQYIRAVLTGAGASTNLNCVLQVI